MVIQLTYELKDTERDYSDLYSYIESLGETMHFLKNAWWIDLKQNYEDAILDELKKRMGSEDLFQIVNVTDQYTNGWLAKSSWDWMKEHNKITK